MSFTSSVPVTPLVRPDEEFVFRARWIQNSLFYRQGYRECRPASRDPALGDALHNIHTFYRRDFALADKPITSAVLRVTADDCFRLFLNGAFAAMGPAQSYPCHYAYQIYDVTDALNRRPGALTVAAHVYCFGEYGFSYISADRLEGFFMQLDIAYEDGSTQRLVTDASWKYMTCTGYGGKNLYGYATQFSEEITLADIPAGWTDPGFDDAAWDHAVVRGTPYPMAYRLFPQSTPPLSMEYLTPASAARLDDGSTLLDMGREIVGITEIDCTGLTDPFTVRHAEELLPDGHARFCLRANCLYEDSITPDGRAGSVSLFEPKGFRWVELPPSYPYRDGCLRVLKVNYPFREAGRMTCADPDFEAIWRLCKNGVEVGTQDTYLDCPTREKGGFIGDAYITAFSHLLLTGDARVLRKLLLDIAHSLRMDPDQTDVVPSYITGGLTDYALLVPSLLLRYYQATADADTVRALLPVLDANAELMRSFENADGLITRPVSRVNSIQKDDKTTLVDWPMDLLGDYDFAPAADGTSSVLNSLYYGNLRAAAALYALCGEADNASDRTKKAEAVAAALVRTCYDPAQGLFTDHTGTTHASLHANAPALCFGVPFPGGKQAAVDLILSRGLHCGVYFAYYVLRGLWRAGKYNEAWALMNNGTDYGWKAMLRAGATTCMEVWSPDQKWNTSFCHPWSSSPVIFWAEEVCGLTAAAPGWAVLSFAPRVPDGLSSGSVAVPIPTLTGGEPEIISMTFARTGGGMVYTLTLPREMPAVLSLLTDHPTITVDGAPVPLIPGARDGLPDASCSLTLAAGEHLVVV